MTGLGKSKQHIKFEIASFSRCRDNKGEAQNSSLPMPYPLFPLGMIFMVGFVET